MDQIVAQLAKIEIPRGCSVAVVFTDGREVKVITDGVAPAVQLLEQGVDLAKRVTAIQTAGTSGN